MTMSEPQGIRLEFFGPELVDGRPSARTVGFDHAVSRGFYEPEADEAAQRTVAELDLADRASYIAAHDDAAPGASLHAGAPVGTYLSFPGTINVGGPRLLEVNQISGVTVSPTHRRRGVLRSMIAADLQRAVDNGMALAALTASEATIYGRFGFGLATERVKFELEVTDGARMRAQPTGSVIAVAPSSLEDRVRDLLAAQHRATFGSVSSVSFDYGQATGRWKSFQELKPNKELRAALHLDEHGQPDGFVSYSFAGWEQEQPQLNINTLCAPTPRIRWELVEYLGAHDLIRKVVGRGPVDDILPTALVNPRDYKVVGARDHLWLRILDLPAALAGRRYLHEGSVHLQVDDGLGHAAGTWQLQVRDGQMTAAPAAEAADAEARLDVRDLATLYLGTRSATHLAAAGVLHARSPQVLELLDALFAVPATAYCYSDF